MPLLENSHHEAFAQARFSGKSLVEAHYAAGYSGSKTTASRLNRLPDIRDRIAELHRASADQSTYDKAQAVQDLVAIIHAAPSEAGDDHPLCELRIGKDGPYHRFPPKLQAMARLIKLMGWIESIPQEPPPKDYLKEWIADQRSGRRYQSGTGCQPVGVTGSQPVAHPHSPSSSSASSSSSSSSSASSSSAPSSSSDPTNSKPTDAPPDLPDWIRILPDDSCFVGHPNYTNDELTPRQEAFAQFRFQGMGVMEAYHAAGYKGDTPNLASRLNGKPAVQARLVQLNRRVEHVCGYTRDEAVRDLVTIIRACPSTAGPDHPYCEMRMTSWGVYHRFPSKLGAITLLARLLGWIAKPGEPPPKDDPNSGFKSFAKIGRRS